MGRDRQRRKERQKQRQQKPPGPKPGVPMDKWSIEQPFDSAEYLKRAALPTYDDEHPPPEK